MYSGNLIDQLLAAVERAEQRASERSEAALLEQFYAISAQELSQLDHDLVGVA
ncbi:MAG TPA: hypothetical protein VJQ82_12345 [Terriglobales bacterium]|nr:hypothetical protein [Terriglobales bacterium]